MYDWTTRYFIKEETHENPKYKQPKKIYNTLPIPKRGRQASEIERVLIVLCCCFSKVWQLAEKTWFFYVKMTSDSELYAYSTKNYTTCLQHMR